VAPRGRIAKSTVASLLSNSGARPNGTGFVHVVEKAHFLTTTSKDGNTQLDFKNKAAQISLFDFKSPNMRAFHVSWFAFFLCFFAWFGIAPLMKVVREELNLTPAQVGNCMIASVAATIIGRLFIGWLCDRIGPRIAYSGLLVLGSLPVMAIGLAQSYESFLIMRLFIGLIGASFVITQYHTSIMFAPNCVGTANATTAGWGNLGGGVTQLAMPLVFSAFIALGVDSFWGWRLSMVVAGIVCLLTGVAYYFFTQDAADGNFAELRARGEMPQKRASNGSFAAACKDYRVWILFFIYAACFGMELTVYNVAALYFIDYFGLGLKVAGLMAAMYGAMNICSRTLGGIISDRISLKSGLKGRIRWLAIALLCEGIMLVCFSRAGYLPLAIGSMMLFGFFTQMCNGATYSVVPFVNKKALGSVAGIVGAGGNAGAVAAGFLFKGGMLWPDALMTLGIIVVCIAFVVPLVRFSPEAEKDARAELERRLPEAVPAV